MKIQVYYIGKDSKNSFSDIEKQYISRINHYSKMEVKRIIPPKHFSKLPVSELRKNEEELFLKQISSNEFVVLLDEKGKQLDSIGFSNFLQKKLNSGTKTLSFIIGGAFGFSDEFKKKINSSLRLSDLTFPHHLARVVLLEQIYRGFSILNNEPYHNP